MGKTYYKNLIFQERGGLWICKFEFSDDPEGFFMPIVFEAETRLEVDQKFTKFVGEDSINIKK